MGEQRFACTACGACCYGWLPLTLDEALAHADLFPLAMALMPVRANERGFALACKGGAVLPLSARQKLAVLVRPIAYIPPSMPCPLLGADRLCGRQATKPLRCRTMPFSPVREEAFQADMLVPRKGWLCDTSAAAPVVYREGRILDRTDFDKERAALEKQAPALQAYAAKMLTQNANVRGRVLKVAQGPVAGRVVVNFASFLRFDRAYDFGAFALKQHDVMVRWAEQTASDPALAEYTAYYRGVVDDLAWFVRREEQKES